MTFFDSVKSGLSQFGSGLKYGLSTASSLAKDVSNVADAATPFVSSISPVYGAGLMGVSSGLKAGAAIADEIPKSSLLK